MSTGENKNDKLKFIKSVFDKVYSIIDERNKGKFFKSISELDKSYSRVVNIPDIIRINENFYIGKFYSKRYPNLSLDVRFRIFKKEDVENFDDGKGGADSLESFTNESFRKKIYNIFETYKDEENVILIYYVYNGMDYSELDKNFFFYLPKNNKFINYDVLHRAPLIFKKLESGKLYINAIDVGTYDLFTIGEYVPSSLSNTQGNKYISIRGIHTPDILSFRKTDLPINVSYITDKLMNLGDPNSKEEFLNEVEEKFEILVEEIVHIYTDVFKDLIRVGKVVNITAPPHINSDVKRMIHILKNMNEPREYKNHFYMKYLVDKLLSYMFLKYVFKFLKRYFVNSRALFVVTFDINFFPYFKEVNLGNLKGDYIQDKNVAIAKCFDSFFYINTEKKSFKCFHRQILDNIKFLMNEKIENLLKEYLLSEQNEVSKKYSIDFVKIEFEPVRVTSVIDTYLRVSKKILNPLSISKQNKKEC